MAKRSNKEIRSIKDRRRCQRPNDSARWEERLLNELKQLREGVTDHDDRTNK